VTQADEQFIRALVERSTAAYTAGGFAAFFWTIPNTTSLDIFGRSGARTSHVVTNSEIEGKWREQARAFYARGGPEVHRLSLDAFAEQLKQYPRAHQRDAYKETTVGMGLYETCYEYALLGYAGVPFGHDMVKSANDVLDRVKQFGEKEERAFLDLIGVLDSIASTKFDIIAVVNQKIQDARLEWQQSQLPVADFYVRKKRKLRIT
jgi:hypothetical protein